MKNWFAVQIRTLALSFRSLSQSSSVSCAFEISANACEIKLYLKKYQRYLKGLLTTSFTFVNIFLIHVFVGTRIVFISDAICGGYRTSTSGLIAYHQYPGQTRQRKNCLWIIRKLGATQIYIEVDGEVDIRKDEDGSCLDYLATAYPGITQPVVECGRAIVDKEVKADQVWIEFVKNSPSSNVASVFRLRYYTEGQTTTMTATTTMTTPQTSLTGKNFFAIHFKINFVTSCFWLSRELVVWCISSCSCPLDRFNRLMIADKCFVEVTGRTECFVEVTGGKIMKWWFSFSQDELNFSERIVKFAECCYSVFTFFVLWFSLYKFR